MSTDTVVAPTVTPSPVSTRALTAVFTLTTFVASGLLFLVEPMVAKSVLPLYGGSPSVSWEPA
jgi:hypothetical protein